MTKKGGKRNDCENCEHKQERVSGRRNPCGDQYGWHKYQHPEQRSMPDFPEQGVHDIVRLLIVLSAR
jgi:hypothetical protein